MLDALVVVKVTEAGACCAGILDGETTRVLELLDALNASFSASCSSKVFDSEFSNSPSFNVYTLLFRL
jgi:hypothetical protein